LNNCISRFRIFLKINEQADIAIRKPPLQLLHETGFPHAPLSNKGDMRPFINLASQNPDIIRSSPKPITINPVSLCLPQRPFHTILPSRFSISSLTNSFVGILKKQNNKSKSCPTLLLATKVLGRTE
jgi:hypothetical protein